MLILVQLNPKYSIHTNNLNIATNSEMARFFFWGKNSMDFLFKIKKKGKKFNAHTRDKRVTEID